MQSWHLSVQREIGANMVVDVAYVGNRAEDMLLFANYNQAVPNNAAGTLTLQHQPYNNTTSFVWSLPVGRGERWMGNASRALDLLVGGWQFAGISSFYSGEPVTFTYTPAAAALVSGITQDFRGLQLGFKLNF